jgi:hypothetical protein
MTTPSTSPQAIYTAFDANLTEASEAVVGSAAMFRFELADNLNFRHLAKIESIVDSTQKRRRRRIVVNES